MKGVNVVAGGAGGVKTSEAGQAGQGVGVGGMIQQGHQIVPIHVTGGNTNTSQPQYLVSIMTFLHYAPPVLRQMLL